MPKVPKAKAKVDVNGYVKPEEWAQVFAPGDDGLVDAPAPARPPGGKIIASVDSPTCPRCSAPVVATSQADRICNSCGLGFTVVTARDELDLKADRELRSRAFNEERGRGRAIPKGGARW